MTPHIIYILCA